MSLTGRREGVIEGQKYFLKERAPVLEESLIYLVNIEQDPHPDARQTWKGTTMAESLDKTRTQWHLSEAVIRLFTELIHLTKGRKIIWE